MIGFVDVVTPAERMMARCGGCRQLVHRSESHVRIRDYCSMRCIEIDRERERQAGAIDVILNLGVRGLAAIVGLGAFLMILRMAGFVGPVTHP